MLFDKITNRVRDVMGRRPFLLSGSLILLVCFLAYGLTLQMYFWHDDYTILYKVQNPNEEAGVYGTGIIGRDSPYRYAALPFAFVYPFFGLSATPYYLVGIILYFFAAISVYFLAKTLTDKKWIAFAASLIFASGYVGSESLYKLANSWQNLFAIVLLSLTTAFYFKYVKSPKTIFYFLALGFYLFTIEYVFIRAHGIVFLILGIELLFNLKLPKSIFRMAPFVLGYWYFYFLTTGSSVGGSGLVSNFLGSIVKGKNYNFILTPFITLQNVFIPDKFEFPLVGFIGILFIILVWKKSKILLFCMLFIVAQYLFHFVTFPGGVQNTTHRYLTQSFVGSSIFLGILLGNFSKNVVLFGLLLVLIVVTNVILVRFDQVELLLSRSDPSQEFWEELKKEVQDLSPNSAVYVDTRNDGLSKPAYDYAIGVGSMSGSASIAVHYGLKSQDVYIAENFPELLSFIEDGKVDKDNIYTFFYSRDGGLVNTTDNTRTALFGFKRRELVGGLDNINLKYSSPVVLNFTSNVSVDFSDVDFSDGGKIDLPRYLSYLSAREEYYETLSASSSTAAKYEGIEKLIDKDKATGWRSGVEWYENGKEEVIFDLGISRKVGGVKFIPGFSSRVPTKYKYECSIDGKSWKGLASIEREFEGQDFVIDKFSSIDCAFVKLVIYDTSGHETPQIQELEVVEVANVDLDFELADKVSENPFVFINSLSDKQALLNYFSNTGIDVRVCIYTDKYNDLEPYCQRYKFKLGANRSVSIFVEPGGSVLEKVEFVVPAGVKVDMSNIVVEYLSYLELEKRGYILD